MKELSLKFSKILFLITLTISLLINVKTSEINLMIAKEIDNNDNLQNNTIEKSKTSESLTRVLYLTDMHLDIFYDSLATVDPLMCKKNYSDDFDNPIFSDKDIKLDPKDYGRFDCDSNKNLVENIMKKASQLQTEGNFKYDSIIILGDDIAHYLNRDKSNINENYEKTLKYINELLNKYFPSIKVDWSLGNNDFHERYDFPSVESYNKQIVQLYKYLRLNHKQEIYSENSKINEEEYLDSWYVTNINDKIVSFMFNSVLLNKKATKLFKKISNYDITLFNKYENLVKRQFDLLEQMLKDCKEKNKKMILNYHIPVFLRYVDGKFNKNWDSDYSKKFDDLMDKYENQILAVFSSHYHHGALGLRKRDKNNLINDIKVNEDRLYMTNFNMPGVTPNTGAGSGFSIVSFGADKIEDITNYYFNISNKKSRNLKIISDGFSKFNLKSDLGLKSYDHLGIYDLIIDSIANKSSQLKMCKYLMGMPFINDLNALRKLLRLNKESDYKDHMCSFLIIDSNEKKEVCKKIYNTKMSSETIEDVENNVEINIKLDKKQRKLKNRSNMKDIFNRLSEIENMSENFMNKN